MDRNSLSMALKKQKSTLLMYYNIVYGIKNKEHGSYPSI